MKRRTLLTAGPVIAATLAGFSHSLTAQEQALKPLDLSNPAAKALHYVDDTANADPELYDMQSQQKCSNCIHFKGKDLAH